MNNGAAFMEAFNDIEAALRVRVKVKEFASFASLIKDAHLRPGDVNKLHAFAALRNAIAHDKYYDGKPIADPATEVVVDIQHLRDEIVAPQLVLTVLGSQPPTVVAPSDPLVDALQVLKSGDFSQVPVYDAGGWCQGLLTTNAICRWVAARVEGDGTLLLDNPTVGDALAFVEPHETAKFCPRTMTASQAVLELSGGRTTAPPLVLVITHNGSPQESPLRLINVHDIPTLNAAIDGTVSGGRNRR